MFSPIALLLIPLGYFFLWPLLAWLQRRWPSPDQSWLETPFLALVFSSALLAWLLFWLGILPGSWITGWSALSIVVLGFVIGLWLNPAWLSLDRSKSYWHKIWRRLVALDTESIILWLVIIAAWIMLIHALYYPFIGEDTLARYGLYAKLIYLHHQIPPTIIGYPPLTALVWAATWFSAGQINEHLARLYSVLMSIGCIGSTYLVGRKIGGKRLALISSALLVVTPMFFRNSTLDYVDIPTTFPLTLSLLYVFRWWEDGRIWNSVLAGILVAIAIFTKQSALTWLPSLAVIPILWLLAARNNLPERPLNRTFTGFVGFLMPSLVIAAPWYIRNILFSGLGNAVPVAGLYYLLGPMTGWLGFAPPLAWRNDFGRRLNTFYAAGWITGLLIAVYQGIKTLLARLDKTPYHLILGLVAVPYWLVWWRTFSFEARFLVLILPIMAIWFGLVLLALFDWVIPQVQIPEWMLRSATAIILFTLLTAAAWDRLGSIYNALAHPFVSEEQRTLYVKGPVYDLALYIRSHIDPEHTHILSMDGRLPYYLPEYNIQVAYPLTLAELGGYDLVVHSSSMDAIYTPRLGWNTSEFYLYVWDPRVFDTVYESGGVHIMKILATKAPPGRPLRTLTDPTLIDPENP